MRTPVILSAGVLAGVEGSSRGWIETASAARRTKSLALSRIARFKFRAHRKSGDSLHSMQDPSTSRLRRFARDDRLSAIACLLILVLNSLAFAADSSAPTSNPLQLFDGTLTGWHQCGPGGFDIADGVLTARGGMGLLWNDREFG